MPEGTCSINECPRPVRAHGWCQMHYFRWYAHGDPGPARPYRIKKRSAPVACKVDDCESPPIGHSFCSKHLQRWRKYGDPLYVQKPHRAPVPVCKIPGCDRPHDARGWCSKHYSRWHDCGDPLAPLRRRIPAKDRFWPKVDRRGDDECWPWTGARNSDGYGLLKGGYAHRVSWSIHHDDALIPPGMVICHRCDNPPCVNPAHLFIGTHADNARDKMSKGRHWPGAGKILLTTSQVRELSMALAKEYQITAVAAAEFLRAAAVAKPDGSDVA